MTTPEENPRRERAAALLAIALCLIAIGMSAELPIWLGIAIYTEQALALILGCALGILYVGLGRGPVGPILAAVSVTASALLAWRYPELASDFYGLRFEAMAFGLVLLPLLIEGVRRRTGFGLVAVTLVFIVYALIADLVPGTLRGRAMDFVGLFSFLTVDNMALFGLPLNISALVVVVFVLFGQLLLRAGGSDWFTDLATSMMGRSRGGSAKIAVMASALFGSISGSAVSNVASTGVITIPLMKKSGFDARSAGAFEAVASTGGQLMPPIMGAAAFLMAELLNTSYGEIILAALIPAFLFYVAVLIQADFESAKRGIAPVPRDQIKPIGQVLRQGWHFMLPFAVLIIALFEFNLSAAEAALLAVIVLFALGGFFDYEGRRLRLGDIIPALAETGKTSVEIVLVGAVAGLIIGILENTGLSFGLTFLLVKIGAGSLAPLLVLTAIICIILGMGMPTTGIYLLVAVLAVPPLVELGVEPIAAHMFVLYFGLMSMISPPVAIAAFTAAAISGARPIDTAMTSMRLGWAAFIVPFLFIKSPALLMQGDWIHILLDTTTAVAGIWLVSAALMGWLRKPLGPVARLVAITAGAALLIPPGGEGLWIAVNGAGFAAGAALVIIEFRKARNATP